MGWRVYKSFLSGALPVCRISSMKRRASSLVTAIVFLAILWLVLDKLHIVIWVNTPWWGFLLMGVVLFFIIDFAVSRVMDRS